MFKQVVIVLCLFVSACSSSLTKEEVEMYKSNRALIQNQLDKPTLSISCPNGCKGLDLQYNDPTKVSNISTSIPKRTNGYDVMNSLIRVTGGIVSSTVPWAASAYMVTEGFKAAGNVNSNNTTRGDVDSSSGPVDNSVMGDTDSSVDNSVDNTSEPIVVSPEVVNPVVVNPEVVQVPNNQ